MLTPWLGILLVLGVLGIVFIVLRFLQTRYSPHPELLRKLLHIIMGVVTLSFPWLFSTSWPVWLLASSSILVLFAIKFSKDLNKQLGKVVHGIERKSFGELYFPLAVAIIFQLSGGNLVLYFIPILILTLADAFAALVGIQFGRLLYSTAEGKKSIEGSFAFFSTTFLSVLIPLFVFKNMPILNILLISLIIGTLGMLVEAIAWRGLDNLFLPLSTYAMLVIYFNMSTHDLVLRLIVIAVFTSAMFIFRKKTTMDDSAILGAVLVAYVSWALGGWYWLLPPFILLVSYPFLIFRSKNIGSQEHNIFAVVGTTGAGMVWLFLDHTTSYQGLLLPFILAFAAQLAMIGIARLKHASTNKTNFTIAIQSILHAWGILFLPCLVISQASSNLWVGSAIGLLGITVAAFLFLFIQPGLEGYLTNKSRWWSQGIIGAASSTIGLISLVS